MSRMIQLNISPNKLGFMPCTCNRSSTKQCFQWCASKQCAQWYDTKTISLQGKLTPKSFCEVCCCTFHVHLHSLFRICITLTYWDLQGEDQTLQSFLTLLLPPVLLRLHNASHSTMETTLSDPCCSPDFHNATFVPITCFTLETDACWRPATETNQTLAGR